MSGIGERQKEYAFAKCFDSYMYRTKKVSVCFECGHKWEHGTSHLMDAIIGNDCPECGAKLKLSQTREQSRKDTEYFCVFTSFKQYQVIRYYIARRWCKLGEKARYETDEVIQHWIRPDGKRVIMTIRVNGMSMYYDNWSFGSDMEVRKEHRRSFPPIQSVITYPKKRFIPNIIRNGFYGDFFHVHPSDLFCMILGDNKAETLLKTNQFKLIEHYHHSQNEIERYWASIKICNRNGYIIPDASMWFDHIKLLERFGKDIRNPKYICPRNLNADHSRLLNKDMKINNRVKYEQTKKEERENKLFREAKKRLFDLIFTDGKINVVALKTPSQFKKEGEILKHCVYKSEYHKKDASLIMSARIGKRGLKPLKYHCEI